MNYRAKRSDVEGSLCDGSVQENLHPVVGDVLYYIQVIRRSLGEIEVQKTTRNFIIRIQIGVFQVFEEKVGVAVRIVHFVEEDVFAG